MINIIKATKEHIPEILRIGNELISPAWTHKMLLSELNNGDSEIFVAVGKQGDGSSAFLYRNKKAEEPSPCFLHGFVVFRQVGDDGEILQIAVDKAVQRSGVGGLLIDSAIKHAHENELKSIFLEVRKSNVAAVGLYKKHGFENVRERKGYYNDPVEDAIVMARKVHVDNH